MTQEFVTLPREVVEQALEAWARGCPPDCKDGMTDSGGVHPCGEAALIECPSCQAVEALRAALDQPQNHVPDAGNMVPAGWKLVPVEPNCSMVLAGERSLEQHDFLRLDSAYRAMLDAAPQPQALEQPQECHDQRDPLADQQIDAIAESMPGGLDGFLKGWGWRQFARAVLEAAPQPPTTEQSSAVVEECLTDELKPRFSAHDDAERLKSVARGMSYNDHGEAIWKHTLMEIAVRLESGGYAAPQPPALEQQVEKESTCKDYLQVEQEPVAWLKTWNSVGHARTGMQRLDLTPECETWLANMFPTITPLYTHPQPKREPLPDHYINGMFSAASIAEGDMFRRFARAIEAAHNIK